MTLSDGAYWKGLVSFAGLKIGTPHRFRIGDELSHGRTQIPSSLHDVSASSSFLRFILSLKPSASRRAAAILACICSPDISEDIIGRNLFQWVVRGMAERRSLKVSPKAVVVDAAPFRCARFISPSDRATRGGGFLGGDAGSGAGSGGCSDHRCSGASWMEGQGKARVFSIRREAVEKSQSKMPTTI